MAVNGVFASSRQRPASLNFKHWGAFDAVIVGTLNKNYLPYNPRVNRNHSRLHRSADRAAVPKPYNTLQPLESTQNHVKPYKVRGSRWPFPT